MELNKLIFFLIAMLPAVIFVVFIIALLPWQVDYYFCAVSE